MKAIHTSGKLRSSLASFSQMASSRMRLVNDLTNSGIGIGAESRLQVIVGRNRLVDSIAASKQLGFVVERVE